MEDTLEPSPKQIKISRKGFLKLALLAGGVGLGLPIGHQAGKELKSGFEILVGLDEKLAQWALLSEVRKGTYSPDRIGKIRTLEQLKEKLEKRLTNQNGVQTYAVRIIEGTNTLSLDSAQKEDSFAFGSLVKIIACEQALQLQANSNKSMMTNELVYDLLHHSNNDRLIDLTKLLSNSGESAEEILRRVMQNAKVPPRNGLGNLPLIVNTEELTQYFKQLSLPRDMKRAMLQTHADDEQNYGVSKVLLDAAGEDIPIYFKIGLVPNPNKKGEMVNSYYFQFGDNLKVVGYASGEDNFDVHEHMLWVAAHTAMYANKK